MHFNWLLIVRHGQQLQRPQGYALHDDDAIKMFRDFLHAREKESLLKDSMTLILFNLKHHWRTAALATQRRLLLNPSLTGVIVHLLSAPPTR